jgi:uncharacterized MAPEG superfamily protein
MTDSLYTFIAYIAWMLILLLTLGIYRSYVSLSGQRAPNKFSPDGKDVSPFSGRLCRAHANCYEFFPIAGGLLIAAIASGNTEITDPLAIYLLAARIVQSAVHLLSTSIIAVYLRFAFFLVQVGICVTWVIDFLS